MWDMVDDKKWYTTLKSSSIFQETIVRYLMTSVAEVKCNVQKNSNALYNLRKFQRFMASRFRGSTVCPKREYKWLMNYHDHGTKCLHLRQLK